MIGIDYGLNTVVPENPRNYIDAFGKSIKWKNFQYGSKDGYSSYY